VPNWSPVRTFGGYGAWGDKAAAREAPVLHEAKGACGCAHTPAHSSRLPSPTSKRGRDLNPRHTVGTALPDPLLPSRCLSICTASNGLTLTRSSHRQREGCRANTSALAPLASHRRTGVREPTGDLGAIFRKLAGSSGACERHRWPRRQTNPGSLLIHVARRSDDSRLARHNCARSSELRRGKSDGLAGKRACLAPHFAI
jgi:hypothetical protein